MPEKPREPPLKMVRPEIEGTDPAEAPAHRDAEPLPFGRGLAWTPAFERYIGDQIPVSLSEARNAWREWWRDPYIVARLGRSVPHDPMEAVLEYYLTDPEERDAKAIAARFGHTPRWLLVWKSRITHYVRRVYAPYSDFPNPRERSRARKTED